MQLNLVAGPTVAPSAASPSAFTSACSPEASHQHATHTKQATEAVKTRKTVDAHLCWLLGNILEIWGLFFDTRRATFTHFSSFKGKREKQFKALMAVRQNSAEATAGVVVASWWPRRDAFHTKRHTRINMCKSELVACARRATAEKKKTQECQQHWHTLADTSTHF